MAEQDQQNSVPETDDLSDLEPGGDAGVNQEKSASGRSWTTVAIVAVAIFICIATLFIIFLLRNRTSEPEDAAAETRVAVAAVDDVWSAIQERGTIIVGTAADYPPFEFYDRDFQLDGLDIALMNEIGRRLDLEVELRDMAFDGLGNALRVEQIDAAISAISITDQRRQFVDFSDTYFVSADALLASDGASYAAITDLDEIGGRRLGVERGTIYDSWASTELVEAGILSADSVFEYERMGDAITDLRAGRIDLVALDLQPAQVAEASGGLQVVAQGLNQQNFGIAVPKGASELLARLNESLQEMEEDGTLRALSAEYTGLTEEAIQPLPPSEPTPESGTDPALKPAPGGEPAPAPGGCIDSSEYVSDLSYDDQNLTDFPELTPGEAFRKGWRLRNSGTCTWTVRYALAPAGGDRLGGNLVLVENPIAPGDEYDFWVDLVAPIVPGDYVGYWSMRNDQSGLLFGDRVSVAIKVVPAPEPTPLPTQTPAPGISFSASPETIQQGQCTTLSWNTQNVDSVYLYEQGEDWRAHQVPESGTVTACPPTNTTYELRVVLNDGSVEVRTVTVFVTPNTAVPQITRFTVDPPDQIAAGQCVTIRWTVEGAVSTVNIGRSGVVIWPNAPFGGTMQDCPPGLGQQFYTIEAMGPGGTSQASWTINVVDSSTAVPTSTPTVAPGTPTPSYEPVIYYFQAQPSTISRNNCVTLSWSAGGNATQVNIVRNNVTIQENVTHRGSW
ncbi:MAG TPA: transporter substrate-binding domain-containing protein, partial [Anaerolineae bacterium]|nr:transporter substrate-binding domain-containing protein [Anaerolineae bacterium]